MFYTLDNKIIISYTINSNVDTNTKYWYNICNDY